MRKFLLSAIVVISFIGYALYIKTKGVAQTPIIAPHTLQSNKITTSPSRKPIPTQISSSPSPAVSLTQPITVVQQPTATQIPTTQTSESGAQYKDGTYKGDSEDAFYGNIQVQVTVSGGKITSVQFLQYPNDNGTSVAVNQQADPMLVQEAIQVQSAQVDIVSGATQSSQAFIQSMQTALAQAKS
jgi:uncharacterized protein with FMN-binding domain